MAYYPEVSWNETWNGTKQMRVIEVSDSDRLQICKILYRRAITLTGATTVMTMAWERVAP